MRRNLEISGPLLLSEAVASSVAPLLGEDRTDAKAKLQSIVDETLQAPVAEQARIYAKLLREAVPASKLSDEELAARLDPANYVGEAAEISRRILAAYPEFTSTHPKGADRG
jgi:3-carboxy-cis,cis-muconate cycloisomerase